MTKISNLTATTSLVETDELVLARAGTSRKFTALAAGLWGNVRKAADESVASSTTVQNDDELFFTAVSGGQYEIEVMLVYGSPAGGTTPDLKIDLGEDTTARGVVGTLVGFSNTDVAFGNVFGATNQTATWIFGTATTDRIAKLVGVHTGGGGTFRLRWAQNVSGVNATIVRAGSLIRYRRVV